MLTLFEFSQQIAKLKKENKYTEALTYFKENKGNFTKEQIRNNEYIVSDIISCLRHSNHLDEGFKFLSIYEIEINEKQKERILSAYGWLLWNKYKNEYEGKDHSLTEYDVFDEEDEEGEIEDDDFRKSELLEKIETLIQILNSFNSDFTKTLYSNLFNVVLKSEKNKSAPNWKLINEFCDIIDKEKLSKECSTIQIERKGQLKDMELASDFEKWYASKTKALRKLGKWQECLELSKEALEKIEKFHYSNDLWFSRNIALSKKFLGNTEEAIQELQTILKKKREWFIQKELAELYFEKGDIESAFKYAIDAINNSGELKSKVDLIYLLGQILKQQGKLELSFKHFFLLKLIRQLEGWKIPQKLFEELQTFPFQKIPQEDLDNLKNELQKYWNSFKVPQIKTSYREGEIVRILHDNERGKAGFLKSNGKQYYFSVNPNFHSISKISVGTKVLFEIKPGSDSKKVQTRIKKVIE